MAHSRIVHVRTGLVALAVLVLALLAAPTWTSRGYAAHARAKSSAKHVTIGLVAVNLNSPSITRIKDAFVKAARARGWTVNVFDGRGDQVATNNAAITYIQRHVNAIVNDASPNAQMTGVIKRAHQAHIPFVSIYGGFIPGVDMEVGTNEFVNASMITSEMVARLGDRGRVVKENWTVLQALRDRDHAFHAVLSDEKGITIAKEIEIKVPGQVDDAYNQTVNVLRSDHTIDAIWIGWDELAPPVVRAIKAVHYAHKIFVVGFDGNPFAWDLIRSGSPYIMEPANPFEPMGAKAVDIMAQLLAGKQFAVHEVFMRPCLITQQTVPAHGQFPNWNTCPFFTAETG